MSDELSDLHYSLTALDPIGGALDKALGIEKFEPPAAAPKKKKRKMPVVDEEQAAVARRRSVATQRARSGRASTILTNRESLG
jgi:hypothetical protein